MAAESVGVGVIGLGFMGCTHVRAINEAREAGHPCRLVAVCDGDRARLTGTAARRGNIDTGASAEVLFDPASIVATSDVDVLLAAPGLDLVSICTPTPTHVPLATRALGAGKHVLLEKPVALEAREIERLAGRVVESGRVCMPAMCMRFWPGWRWLHERVSDGSLGQVRSATFHRLGSPPAWSRDFYADEGQTGGALLDLHIHDADLVRWLFGDPASVSSTGTRNHVTTLYRFEGGPHHVVAEGGWGHDPAWPFRMRFVVAFDEGTADFDLARAAPLMLAREGSYEAIPLPPGDGYDGEIRHLVDCLAAGREPEVSLADALAVTRILAAEGRSQGSGAPEVP